MTASQQVFPQQRPALPGQAGELSRLALAGLWLLSGVILLAWIGSPPVVRTQEARVLETARQMLGKGAHGWLVPQINGRLRLQKPPLCYWMAAAGFELAGAVTETAGRIPTAIVGWLTIGITFAFARRLFDQRIALASCGVMLTSYLFFRNTRLAETDAPSMLGVTLAIYAIWRGATGRGWWLHVAVIATCLAILAKGGPGAFPALFLFGYCVAERDWKLAKRFITSGALIWLLLVALPWFAYIWQTLGAGVFRDELDTVASGRDHWDWPYVYIPALLVSVAPWTGILPLALIEAWRKGWRDARMRLLLVWCGSVLLPLCVIGNKQTHYLLPMIPPVMILIGYTVVVATVREHPLFRWMRFVLIGTLLCGAGAVAAILIAPRMTHGHLNHLDIAVAIAVAVGIAVAAAVAWRAGTARGYAALIGCVAVLMPLTVGAWVDTVPRYNPQTVAMEIQQNFGNGPYVFYGPNVSLVLCFNLRQAIPWAPTAEDLSRLVKPGTIVIAQTKSGAEPPPLPIGYALRRQVKGDNQLFDLYEFVQQ